MLFPLLRHIIHKLKGFAAIAAIMVMTLWSCSDFEPGSGIEVDGDGIVSFRVVAPKYAGGGSGSRAIWGENYENQVGTEFETALLDGQVQVVITDADCANEYAITDLWCKKVYDETLFMVYEYVGRIEANDLEAMRNVTNGKFHIIANVGISTGLDEDVKFTRSGRAGEFEAIPMWGVTTVDFSKLVPNNALNIGDVTLLRSMAKVVIDLDKENIDNCIRSIESVTISTTNKDGYLLPEGWKGIVSTGNLNRHSARVPVQNPTEPIKYTMEENHVEFYLPEIFNSTDDEITLTIEYTTDFGPMTGMLYFRRYADGKPGDTALDLLRNYLYHFVVRKPNHEEVNAILDVIPYSSVVLDPDFGLERDPINGWMCFRNEQGFLMCYYDEINKVFYDFDRQRITYDTHPDHASWLKVIDAKENFAWYFDAETGKMYDSNDQEMTGLDRHPVTGWLVRYIPGTKDIDYYVAPMANKVFDRNLNEVELESRDGTNNYKLMRDGDGNIIIKFDPITGLVYDNNEELKTFDQDDKGRIIIKNGSWECRYDRTNGKFYNPDGGVIKNPFTNPSWQQYLYSNGSLICYYDQEAGKFYDIDLDEITFGFHPNNPWFRVVDSQNNFCWYLDYTTGAMYDEQGKSLSLERDRTTGNIIRRASQGRIAYYVDPVSLLVYDSGQNLVRLEHRNEKTNALKVLKFEGTDANHTTATYYFDAAAGILYDKDRNVIYDRLNKEQAQFERDDKGRVKIIDDNGNLFRYYDISKSQFYTDKEIPVSNPFSTQLTPYDDIKNDDGVFICFYNQTEAKFYDGYMREITHEMHPDKPWFKVCDHNGKLAWWVDFLTFKLYDSNEKEFSPKVSHNGVVVTNGERNEKTGRIKFLHFRGPTGVKGSVSYWLDPLSLIMYDRSQREVIFPTDNTRALKTFKIKGKVTYTFDCVLYQFYKNGTATDLWQANGASAGKNTYCLAFRYADNSSYPAYFRPNDEVFSTNQNFTSTITNPFIGQQ